MELDNGTAKRPALLIRVSVMIVSVSVEEAVLVWILYPPEPASIGSIDWTVVLLAKSPPRSWKSDSRNDMYACESRIPVVGLSRQALVIRTSGSRSWASDNGTKRIGTPIAFVNSKVLFNCSC